MYVARLLGYYLKVAWAYWYFALFIVFFLLFYPLFAYFLATPKRYHAGNKLRKVWAVIVMCLVGLPWKICREKSLKKHKAVIYCPNHFSYLDIPMAALGCRGNIRFMAKTELSNIPIFNIFFKTVDIAVNRSSRTESYKSLKVAEDSLEKGFSLVVFPEGTIGTRPPELLPFKNGPFKLAIEKQVPVVPVTFYNNFLHLHVDKKIYGKPGLLKAKFHAPIETAGMTQDDVERLKMLVYDTIANELKSYYNTPLEKHTFVTR